MGKGVSPGATVAASTLKILGKSGAAAQWGKDLWPATITGKVEGRASEGRKWRVTWELKEGTHVGEHGAAVLEVVKPHKAGAAVGEKRMAEVDSDSESEGGGEDGPEARGEDQEGEGEEGEGEDGTVEQVSTDAGAETKIQVGEMVWRVMKGINVCPRAAKGLRVNKPSLVWPRGEGHAMGAPTADGGKSYLSYFLLCTPPNVLDVTLRETNAKLVLKNNGEGRGLTKHELLKSLGVMIALPRSGERVARENWGFDDDAIFRPAEFGTRYGVSVNRHEEIMAAMTMRPDVAPWNDPNDPWQCCSYFEHDFNDHMPRIVRNVDVLVGDESTTRWYGLESWHPDGCPHVTKIARKPENKSIEVRTVAIGPAEMCVFMEVQRGRLDMAKYEFCEPGRNAGTAFMLRATKRYRGTGVVVLGDAAFSSVQTCEDLMTVNGLYYVGCLKTAHKNFPKKFLAEQVFANRGDTITVERLDGEVPIYGHAWADPNKPGKPHKLLVATCGSTLPADPAKRLRYKIDTETGEVESYLKEIPRTMVVKLYYDWAGAIDRFNRIRQWGVRMERGIGTQSWQRRMMYSLWGYVVANAYLAYQLEGGEASLKDFVLGLAKQLLTNTFDGAPAISTLNLRSSVASPSSSFSSPSPRPAAAASLQSQVHVEPRLLHSICSFSKTPEAANRKNPHGTCTLCHNRSATFFCSDCSFIPQHPGRFFLCGPTTGRQCVSRHIQNSLLY